MILQLVIGQRLYELVPVLQALLGLFIAAVATLDLKESGGLSHYLFSSARALFGSDRGGGKLFRLDILQGPAIILWHHLAEAGDGVLPIVEQVGGPFASRVEKMPFHQNPTPPRNVTHTKNG